MGFPAQPPADQPDAGQVSISADELAALRAAAAERDQLRADADAAPAAPAASAGNEPEPPPEPTHRAYLANGEVFEYSGQHPTEVHLEGADAPVPVVRLEPIH